MSTQCISVVVLVKTIRAWPGMPFILIPTLATCDGDKGNTHKVSPLFTLVPLAPAPHPLVIIKSSLGIINHPKPWYLDLQGLDLQKQPLE